MDLLLLVFFYLVSNFSQIPVWSYKFQYDLRFIFDGVVFNKNGQVRNSRHFERSRSLCYEIICMSIRLSIHDTRCKRWDASDALIPIINQKYIGFWSCRPLFSLLFQINIIIYCLLGQKKDKSIHCFRYTRNVICKINKNIIVLNICINIK